MKELGRSNNPLVSVVVITYNSAEFVIETLNSIKNQNYPNIELIISDDCSKDNTIEICCDWIRKNNQRFYRTEIITVPVNTGTTANNNRALKAIKAKWIKFVAGDDALSHTCIRNNMDFIKKNPTARIIISQYKIFNSSFNDANIIGIRPTKDMIGFFTLGAKDQLKIMRFKAEHIILGMFIEKSALIEINGFDERFKLLEDLPLFINLLSAGNKLYFLPEITTYYRRNLNTVSNQKTQTYKLLLNELLNVYRLLRRPYLKLPEKIHNDIYFISEYLLVYGFKGNKSKLYNFIKTAIYQFSPLHHKERNEIRKNL